MPSNSSVYLSGADVSTAQQTSPTDRLQTGPVAMTTEVTDGAAELLLKSEEQSPVTFDELGGMATFLIQRQHIFHLLLVYVPIQYVPM